MTLHMQKALVVPYNMGLIIFLMFTYYTELVAAEI